MFTNKNKDSSSPQKLESTCIHVLKVAGEAMVDKLESVGSVCRHLSLCG